MSRLDATFARLRARGERALVAYFTAGDPSFDMTAELVVEAARRGADVVELGVPFSDPIADGPVIQRAAQRALERGASVARVLDTAGTARSRLGETPLVLLTYYNPVLAFGLKAFARSAVDAGVDGVIVADLPPEEAEPLAREAAPAGLDVIHLVAPTSPPVRARMIAARSRGFVYVVSLTGVTGVRQGVPPELESQLRGLRRVTAKPLCVGFGIARPEDAAAVGRLADGVIVGSALVRLVEERATAPTLIDDVGALVASLKSPLRQPLPREVTTGRAIAGTARRAAPASRPRATR